MRVSVIVPVYNEEKTVARVLELLSQVDLDMEVIVIDDASTDRTWEILQELRQNVSRPPAGDEAESCGSGIHGRGGADLARVGTSVHVEPAGDSQRDHRDDEPG